MFLSIDIVPNKYLTEWNFQQLGDYHMHIRDVLTHVSSLLRPYSGSILFLQSPLGAIGPICQDSVCVVAI